MRVKNSNLNLRIDKKVREKMRALGISPQKALDDFINAHPELSKTWDESTLTALKDFDDTDDFDWAKK